MLLLQVVCVASLWESLLLLQVCGDGNRRGDPRQVGGGGSEGASRGVGRAHEVGGGEGGMGVRVGRGYGGERG